MVEISMHNIVMRNEIAYLQEHSVAANAQAALEWKESDDKIILVIQTDHVGTLTIFNGNGIQGSVKYTLSPGPSNPNLIKLDSGRFKQVSGPYKGKIIIQPDKDIQVDVVPMV